MTSEPIQIGVVKMSVGRRNAVPGQRPRLTQCSAVVDEAFAELPIELSRGRRVDEPKIARAARLAGEEGSLVRHIAIEVASLNRLCAHLSDMLRSIDLPANGK